MLTQIRVESLVYSEVFSPNRVGKSSSWGLYDTKKEYDRFIRSFVLVMRSGSKVRDVFSLSNRFIGANIIPSELERARCAP